MFPKVRSLFGKGKEKAKDEEKQVEVQTGQAVNAPALTTLARGGSHIFSPSQRFGEDQFLSAFYRNSTAQRPKEDQGSNNDFRDPDYIIVQYLENHCQSREWFKLLKEGSPHSVKKCPKVGNQLKFRYFPPCDDVENDSFVSCVARYLQMDVAIKISFPIIHAILDLSASDAEIIALDDNTRIQVLDTVYDLIHAKKYQYCAFIRSEKCMIVWSYSVPEIIKFTESLESKMVKAFWDIGYSKDSKSVVRTTEIISSQVSSSQDSSELSQTNNMIIEETGSVDTDTEKQAVKPRPVQLVYALNSALALILIMTWLGLYVSQVCVMIAEEGDYLSVVFLLYAVPFFLFSSFFSLIVIGSIFFIFGPVAQCHSNSYAFSVKKPRRLSPDDGPLPHVTIQCPVYKESLENVIKPTIESLTKAIHTYELQGGSANLFINDDGLQVLPQEEAQVRISYYQDNNIGYVARPGHGVDEFVRAGRFKKASNMNYCLDISNKVEEKLEAVDRSDENWGPINECNAYINAVSEVIEEDGKCWVGGDIRVGNIILLVDSDTRVPEDCILDAVSEMTESPEVAIIQNSSGVMMVVNNYWEQLIAWFTRMIYFSIAYCTASGGDQAAFVGHNAFLRWSAIQEVGYEQDGRIKYWSEAHVSEDFEMSLNLGALGYVIRMATYHGDGFKEGVSLTIYDEVTRWSKYAYGCSEIIFYPVRHWWRGRILTPLFIKFLRSNITLATKLSIFAYMGTYFALASSLISLIVNYFVVGWYSWGYAKFYSDSFTILIALMFVFGVASRIAEIIARYRIRHENPLIGLAEFRWSIIMSVFFGGLSWHMSVAILCHLFSIPLSWGATAKELDDSNFFKELPKAIKSYRVMYVVVILLTAMLVALAKFVPYSYQINGIVAILPLAYTLGCHLLMPLVFNPQLTSFSW